MRASTMILLLTASCTQDPHAADTPREPDAADSPLLEIMVPREPDTARLDACGEPMFPEAGKLMRWPYLQHVTDNAATIAWGTSVGPATQVMWGDELVAVPRQKIVDELSPTMVLNHVRLNGLAPDTIYCYRVIVDGETVATSSFRTANPSLDATVRFVVIGDYGNGSADQAAVHDALLQWQDHVDFWLTTGDNAYHSGSHADFQQNVFSVYRDLWHRVPVFPVPGNHDWDSGSLAPYTDNFFLPEQTYGADVQEAYYAMDWGPVHFTGLDSDRTMQQLTDAPGDDQMDFLRDDLAAPTDRWRVMSWHHPAYMGHPSRTAEPPVWELLRPTVEQSGVDIVFSGHNHTYERFPDIRDSQRVEDGTTWIITGGGGASLYRVVQNPLHGAFEAAHHFTLVDVNRCEMRIRAITADMRIIDDHVMTRCD